MTLEVGKKEKKYFHSFQSEIFFRDQNLKFYMENRYGKHISSKESVSSPTKNSLQFTCTLYFWTKSCLP